MRETNSYLGRHLLLAALLLYEELALHQQPDLLRHLVAGLTQQALGHLQLVHLPVQREVHVVPDEVAALPAGPVGEALLVDVERLRAGPRLAVHPDLEVVHAGDLLLQLGQLGVQLAPPELHIANSQLELLVHLGLVLVHPDLGVLNQSFRLLQQPLSSQALGLSSV